MNKKIEKLLNKNNVKHTTARKAILEALYKASKPLSYELIKTSLEIEMDKATFYRNIALFEESGIVHKFDSDDKKWYFELAKKTHAHFICESCHDITCMDFNIGKNFKEHNVKNIILKGVCKDCKQ